MSDSNIVQPLNESDSRLWSTLAHVGVILTAFIGPLVVWIVFRERSSVVDEHAKEATNFGFLAMVGYILAGLLWFSPLGKLVNLAVFVGVLIFAIPAIIAANNGQPYRYPYTLRLIK